MGGGTAALSADRERILAFRRGVQGLDTKLPPGGASLQRAAWAGLQDSVPRSALHALHARVEGIGPQAWEDPALVQVWGPRYTAFVVPAGAHLPFTLGRMPERGRMRERARDLAARAKAHLDGRRLPVDQVAEGIGTNNAIRYASLTGTVLIRWGGARQPLIWSLPDPEISPAMALRELVCRYLHVYGPSTVDAFVRWAGVEGTTAAAAFAAVGGELVAVRTPMGEGVLLAEDEPALRGARTETDAARLLPSGDPYYLQWGTDRAFLVPDAGRAAQLWTSRVWPGALLVGGEIAGIWRRAGAVVVATPWRRMSANERRAVEQEASTMPLPDTTTAPMVRWEGP